MIKVPSVRGRFGVRYTPENEEMTGKANIYEDVCSISPIKQMVDFPLPC